MVGKLREIGLTTRFTALLVRTTEATWQALVSLKFPIARSVTLRIEVGVSITTRQLLRLLLWAVRKQLDRSGRTLLRLGFLCRIPITSEGRLVFVKQDRFLVPRETLGEEEEATICPLAVVILHITPTVVILSLVRRK